MVRLKPGQPSICFKCFQAQMWINHFVSCQELLQKITPFVEMSSPKPKLFQGGTEAQSKFYLSFPSCSCPVQGSSHVVQFSFPPVEPHFLLTIHKVWLGFLCLPHIEAGMRPACFFQFSVGCQAL